MEIQFWSVVWGMRFLGKVSFGNSVLGCRLGSMFLGEFSFGNSVLGSCAVGLFVPDFDWKFSLGSLGVRLFIPDFDWKVSFGYRGAVGQEVSGGHRTSRGSVAGVRRPWEMLIFGDRGGWGGLARVRVRVRETVLVCLRSQWFV